MIHQSDQLKDNLFVQLQGIHFMFYFNALHMIPKDWMFLNTYLESALAPELFYDNAVFNLGKICLHNWLLSAIFVQTW